jgi:predicted site-specific integrase-resolvase
MNVWEWIPLDEAAERLAIGRRIVARFVDAGRIDCLTVDGVRFVWLADVLRTARRERALILIHQRRGFAGV